MAITFIRYDGLKQASKGNDNWVPISSCPDKVIFLAYKISLLMFLL